MPQSSADDRLVRVTLAGLVLGVEVEAPKEALALMARRRLGLSLRDLGEPLVVRRALDARRRPPRYVYTIELSLARALASRLVAQKLVTPVVPIQRRTWRFASRPLGPPPVVVGAGPAGLFAALTLAEAGLAPVVIERGRMVDERAADISRLYRAGVLDPESNVCFGEGGAGTFSDGKLHTRVGDERVRLVLEALVAHGAKQDILVDHRPHLGTDRLVVLLRALRRHLIERGVLFRFGEALHELVVRDGALAGVRLRGGEQMAASYAVLATGHSARDVFSLLDRAGLPLEARSFAVGFRVEHPQELIDELRYGRAGRSSGLPAADYRLAYNERGDAPRGVYSFCMCPGGVVVPTPTVEGELCINGMSHSSRSGRFANSAIVVTVTPADFGGDGALAGVEFQTAIERAAFAQGGGAFCAPAARVADFVAGRRSSTLPKTSYRRGVVNGELDALYPPPLIAVLRRALAYFDRKMPGFVTEEAVLIGVETRTASPVRLIRDEDFGARGCRGLYPAGEGMGYGGGS